MEIAFNTFAKGKQEPSFSYAQDILEFEFFQQEWSECTNHIIGVDNNRENLQFGTLNTDAMYRFPIYESPVYGELKEAFSVRQY